MLNTTGKYFCMNVSLRDFEYHYRAAKINATTIIFYDAGKESVNNKSNINKSQWLILPESYFQSIILTLNGPGHFQMHPKNGVQTSNRNIS